MSRARDRADGDFAGKELIFDADGDTSITADTDDQIDIKIAGQDDFQFTANTFTAASGSSVATNTISETTSGSGVTIDSVLLKDGDLQTGVNRYVDIRDADGHVSGRLRNVSGSNNALTIEADPDNSASGSYVSFKVDTSEKMKVDDTGDVTISDGDLVIGTSGHGIDFSANTESSVTGVSNQSELFDYYEEGTWTPAPKGASTAGSVTSGTTLGRYTRVGNMVTVEYRLSAVVLASASGSYRIGGLPYTVGGTDYNGGACALHSVTFDGDQEVTLNATGTELYFIVSRSGTSWTSLDQSAFGSQHYSHGTITYTV
jgi:hypothetical protein